ncbi:ThuA domain-containing protein [Sphingorhabdus sp.]|uniref:ThuA domain-containing protein n=1 Tax=Sphingorhabdus sp. TaxID=1902408 RepID=UPI00404877A2
MARILKTTVYVFLLLFLLLGIGGVWLIGRGNVSRIFLSTGITYDTEAPKLPEMANPAILIFSKTNGFRADDQIVAANTALEALAKENGWSSFTTENAAVFNTEQLGKFKAIVWNSTSGDVLTPDQRTAFKSWLGAGGGYVGLHGAGGDPSYKWKWYVDDLIGAQFTGHTLGPHIQKARLVIEDMAHPATRGMKSEWVRTDEWYSFAASPRAKGYHVLVTIDEASYLPVEGFIPFRKPKDISMGKDHPLIWWHCVGKGRALYSALGHTPESYAEPQHLQLLQGAMGWAAGLERPTCTDESDAKQKDTS